MMTPCILSERHATESVNRRPEEWAEAIAGAGGEASHIGATKGQGGTLARMRLTDFATAGRLLRVDSEVLGETVVFASDNVSLEGVEDCVVYRAADLAVLWTLGPDVLRAVHAAMCPLRPSRWWSPRPLFVGWTGDTPNYWAWDGDYNWSAATGGSPLPIEEQDLRLGPRVPQLRTAAPGKKLTTYMKRKNELIYQQDQERTFADEPGRKVYAEASVRLARRVTIILSTLCDRLREAEPGWEMRFGRLPVWHGRERTLMIDPGDNCPLIEARVSFSLGRESRIAIMGTPDMSAKSDFERVFRDPPFPAVRDDNRSLMISFKCGGNAAREHPDLKLSGTAEFEGTAGSALLEIALNRCRSLARTPIQ